MQCTFSSEKLLEERADQNFQDKNYTEAQIQYEQLIRKTVDKQKQLKAWKRLAEINHFYLKDGDAAEEAYKKVILYSNVGDDLPGTLKAKADLEMNLMRRADLAIVTLEKLVLLQTKKDEKVKSLLQLTKLYQERRQWDDANTTIQQIVDLTPNQADWFQMQLLKATFLNLNKKYDEETAIYEELLKKSTELSRQNRTALQLVLSYEQRKRWKDAYQALQKWKDLLPEDMVREKEQELQKRMINEPGARGFRK